MPKAQKPGNRGKPKAGRKPKAVKSQREKTLPAADPKAPPKLPYIQFVKTVDGVNFWVVDGAFVRTNIDEEFTNFGQHYRFPQIPKQEIWLDQEHTPNEQPFYIEHALREFHLMAKGADYDTADADADDLERRTRVKAGDVRLVKGDHPLPDPSRVHKRLWKRLTTGVEVWIVDGRLVRSAFNVEFTSGGHEHVYEFVPENEVWIDDDIQPNERGYVLLHELHERALMEKGMNYDDAHADSSRLEHRCREHPSELHDALSEEGWE